MKSPDDIKKGLAVCATLDGDCENCPYDDGRQLLCVDQLKKDALAYINQLEDAIDKTTQLMRSATEVIKKSQEQLESTYSQVKKALCGKENVSWVEVLEAADQLKSRLAQVEREKDAAVDDLRNSFDPCTVCKKQDICEQYCPDNDYNCPGCKDKHRCICHNCTADNDLWEWRGACKENTKEEEK